MLNYVVTAIIIATTSSTLKIRDLTDLICDDRNDCPTFASRSSYSIRWEARAGYRGHYSVSRCIFERHDQRDRVHKLLGNVELVFVQPNLSRLDAKAKKSSECKIVR